jgi:hypothetical protein
VQQFINIVRAIVVKEIASVARASKPKCPGHQATTRIATIPDIDQAAEMADAIATMKIAPTLCYICLNSSLQVAEEFA